MKILLTGSTGFVGKHLVEHLLAKTNNTLNLVVRGSIHQDGCERVAHKTIKNISGNTVWADALMDCELVIHAAARVHIMKEHADDPLAAYRDVNVAGTLNLARQAAQAGIKRFIFLSTIKVNGELTKKNEPFTVDSSEQPLCHYALSKYEAEQGLKALAHETGMEVVIIRPVLIYGVGVKGNFQSMLDAVQKKHVLPLGLVKNQRSFVAIENLVDLIIRCTTHPKAANQTFFVSDDEDLSTTDLLKKIRFFFGKRTILLPIPRWILRLLARIVGKQVEAERLCGFLQVDIHKTRELLDWRPVISVDDALRSTIIALK